MGYREIILADSPVAYWRLGEPSGTNANDEVGTLDGTYVGGPTLGEPGALAGDSDKAVKFVDATDYVTVPDNAVLDLGDGPYSYELWIKRTSVPADLAIFLSKGSQGNLYFNNANNRFTFDNDSTTILTEFGTTADIGVWHHFVIVHAALNDTKLYKDGIEDTAASQFSVSTSNNAANMSIGIYNDLAYGPSLATIDEVAIYNAVLTPTKVAAHFAAAAATLALRSGFALFPKTMLRRIA